MNGVTVIDLSQEIYEGMPMGAALVPTKIFFARTHDVSLPLFDGHISSAHLGLLLCDHCATHVDAQSHNDDRIEAMSIERYPVDRFYTNAVCLDVSGLQFTEYITLGVLEEALNSSGLEIQTEDTVLLYTGTYNRHYPEERYLTEYTGLNAESAEWLVERGVVNIGVDSPSVDHCNELRTPRRYPVHQVLTRSNVNNTENLANLDRVAGRRFVYIGLPLKIRGGTASPVRAIAILTDRVSAE